MKKPSRSQILYAAAAVASGLLLRRVTRPHYTFRGKSVLITGGSRGLGLVIARLLAQEGAQLTLIARTKESLEVAKAELRSTGAQVWTIAADIRDGERAKEAVRETIRHNGVLDVLINNAGIIQVGPVAVMTDYDFEDSLATHFWGPLSLITAALPHMRERRAGRIVNISSIGGRIGLPHLAPYSASKFALAGLSDTLRAELAPEGIIVTSVYPGLMRTGSHINANFKGDHAKEFAWFSVMAGLPLFSIDVRRAARQIIEGCRRGKPDLIITTQARLAIALQGLFPGMMARLMKIVHAMLPTAGGPSNMELRSGWDSISQWAPSILTRLADNAIEQNNEYPAA